MLRPGSTGFGPLAHNAHGPGAGKLDSQNEVIAAHSTKHAQGVGYRIQLNGNGLALSADWCLDRQDGEQQGERGSASHA